jgi:DNA-binding transcriptional ArsR family regulator
MVLDDDITVIRIPNPILDARAKRRQEKGRKLYLPAMPTQVHKRAMKASTLGPSVLSLVGMVVKMTKNIEVVLKLKIIKVIGMSDGQIRRGLRALEDAGLVSVCSAPGKRRKITLLDKEYKQWLLKSRHID